MSDYCPDCGTRRYGGVCSMCQEELYIVENQSEYLEGPLSEEFRYKVAEQRKYLGNKTPLDQDGEGA